MLIAYGRALIVPRMGLGAQKSGPIHAHTLITFIPERIQLASLPSVRAGASSDSGFGASHRSSAVHGVAAKPSLGPRRSLLAGHIPGTERAGMVRVQAPLRGLPVSRRTTITTLRPDAVALR